MKVKRIGLKPPPRRGRTLWTLWEAAGDKWKAAARSKDKDYLKMIRGRCFGMTRILPGRDRPDDKKKGR